MDPRNLELRNFVNLRMVPFHASWIFIAVIAKQVGAAGLKDVCIKPSLIGTGSAESVLNGKQYNKGTRVLNIIYEALQRLKLEAFERWLPSHSTDDQQRAAGIWRNNWNKYIGWSSSKVDTAKSIHRWTYGKLQRKCQS